jgi:acetylornithine/N-succinyldiaminopimelate aminotransferase
VLAGLLDHVNEVGGYFRQQLEALKGQSGSVVEVRGMGLMLGMELDSPRLAQDVVAQLLRRRILINRTSETVLRFLPPYIVEKKHVDAVIRALSEALPATRGRPGLARRPTSLRRSHR